MLFKGRVPLREIEKKPIEIKGTEADAWVQEALERSAPQEEILGLEAKTWAEKSKMETAARLEKVGSEFMVTGSLKATVPTACSRCGDLYQVQREGEFRVFMCPQATKREASPDDDYSNDPDYVFFKSDDINLTELVSEQLIVQEPYAEHPEEEEDGTCTLCHQNPQFTGQSTENATSSAFAKLRTLKGRL